MSFLCYTSRVTQTLTIRLDEPTARRLERESRATRKSKGELVREALEERFTRRRGSALLKYAGLMEGPADLSTNRKHLAGFGRSRKRS
jgi:predicted transcriptional regulator